MSLYVMKNTKKEKINHNFNSHKLKWEFFYLQKIKVPYIYN
jgi:hypothetical protein